MAERSSFFLFESCPFIHLLAQDIIALESWPETRPALEETINDPNVPRHYWRYRVHLTVREMTRSRLLATIQRLVLSSGRCNPDRLPRLYIDDA